MNIKNRTITDYINNRYKQYAIHTLMSRGIPDFYDSLTPIQRYILLNAPTKTNKTLTLVGDCIRDGYHSGNASVESSINRMARPYDCSENLLEGDGFFGNQISSEAAASRYTSIKINKNVHDVIGEFSYLNKKNKDDSYSHLNISIPIGLLIPIIGISVGYKTIILPRSLSDIKSYMSGKTKKLVPSFKNFNGNITRYNGLANSWLLEGVSTLNSRVIKISSMPPLMKYATLIKKLDKILSITEPQNYTVKNNSRESISIEIQFNNKITSDEIDKIFEKINNANKLIVKENILFVKDGAVLEYDSLEDYLDDFIIKNKKLELDALKYNIERQLRELKENKVKLDFIKFFYYNNERPSDEDINNYIDTIDKAYHSIILDIKLIKLNKTEIDRITNKIKTYVEKIKTDRQNYVDLSEAYKNINTTAKTKSRNSIAVYETDDLKLSGNIDIFLYGDDLSEYTEDE